MVLDVGIVLVRVSMLMHIEQNKTKGGKEMIKCPVCQHIMNTEWKCSECEFKTKFHSSYVSHMVAKHGKLK